ncbi:CbtB domain-containing protein [Neotabrizicola sp. VNH66]|uniref:CbtB domain-containing protein n=1 Tax=Neotabrizicola sp. VNH66 TaxID=3400918 RepID=UPI003C100511
MTYATTHMFAVKPIPLPDVMPWAIFGTLIFAIFIYFVGAEQGATAVVQGETIHEFVHDARHLLGFPCH